jgi:ankyrin repeat protein
MIGATPFWEAASFKELEIMRVLAAHGADSRFVMKAGGTALTAVIARGDSTQQHDSITDERKILEAVKYVVSLGVDVNADDGEWTSMDFYGRYTDLGKDMPLHLAASRGFNSVIQYLVEQGARLDVKNVKGDTPLALAVKAKAQTTADLLRALGAKE